MSDSEFAAAIWPNRNGSVDHRREEVDGLHETQVIANAEDARIVGGIEPHE